MVNNSILRMGFYYHRWSINILAHTEIIMTRIYVVSLPKWHFEGGKKQGKRPKKKKKGKKMQIQVLWLINGNCKRQNTDRLLVTNASHKVAMRVQTHKQKHASTHLHKNNGDNHTQYVTSDMLWNQCTKPRQQKTTRWRVPVKPLPKPPHDLVRSSG